MNEKKYEFGRTENIYDVLYTILYDFYVNEDKVKFDQFYNIEDLVYFFDSLIEILPKHSYDLYDTVLKRAFKKEGITYSEKEIFKYFLFNENKLFEDEKVKDSIKELIVEDYKILRYSTTDMVMAVYNTFDEKIIRELIDQIIIKHWFEHTDIFDESMVISFLINKNFHYSEFTEVDSILSQNLLTFIQRYCTTSFFKGFEGDIRYNNLHNFKNEKYDLLIKDQIIWFQFFMFKYFDKANRTLESYSYLKVFFDRFVAHIMYCKGYDQDSKYPNINKYHKVGIIERSIVSLGVSSAGNKTIKEIMQETSDLRNGNPVNHASSEILNSIHISSSEINESTNDLLLVIDLLLEICSKP